ncbi:MAG: AAA family ATPase [Elusimicrobiota bacterium]|nr:MAG: AAA family ATPase [Elusimicrobiota bacterium]
MAIIDVGDLLPRANDAEESKWLVEGLVARSSLGLCGASPKTGKTWLGLQMALAVSTGTPFLGHFKTCKSRVLFWECEDSEKLLAERTSALMRGHGLSSPEPGYLQFAVEPARIDTADGLRRLRQVLAETKAEILLLDTLNRSHGLNESLQTHASQLITAFDGLRREFGVAVLATHHVSKAGRSGQGGKALRGSSVIHAGLENSIYIWATETPGIIRAEPESKYGAPEPFIYEQVSGEGSMRLTRVEDASRLAPFVTKRTKRLERERRKKRAHVGGR